MVVSATQWMCWEWTLSSGRAYDDPFNRVDVNLVVADRWRVPAFWAGDQTWRFRFAPPEEGRFPFRTECSDESNPDLHGREGIIDVAPYRGSNPILSRGPLRVSAERRYLEHADGTPFFWLGDTWTCAFRRTLRFPADVKVLLTDRVEKGFTVILLTAGLVNGMPWPDPRAENEAGLPWEPDFSTINPAFFDMADLRLQAIVDAGIVPCVQGLWGYYAEWLTEEQVRRHWRYVVARWSHHPVVWSLAGEAMLPFAAYTARSPGEVFPDLQPEEIEEELSRRRKGWSELGRYVRSIDPHGRLISIHPKSPGSSREDVDDPSVLDFVMLQTGHIDRDSVPATVQTVVRAIAAEPPMPVLNGEVAYEGMLEMNRQEIVRHMFWVCMLSGACGHTYGTEGVSLANTPEEPWGAVPHGVAWDDTPWEVAYRYPGSTQVGRAKALLERYPWWKFEPHPEWIEPHWSEDNYFRAYAGGIPGEVRFVYFPPGGLWRREGGFSLEQLESGMTYRAYWSDPATGAEHDRGRVAGDANGSATVGIPPVVQDWVLVLERTGDRGA
jgi:hypothetical protein